MTGRSLHDADHSPLGSEPRDLDLQGRSKIISGPPLKKGIAYKLSENGDELIAHEHLLDPNALSDDIMHPSPIRLGQRVSPDDRRRIERIPEGLSIAIPDDLLQLVISAFGKERLGSSVVAETRRLNGIATQQGAIGFWNGRPFQYDHIQAYPSQGYAGLTGEMFNVPDCEIQTIVRKLEERLDKIAFYVQGYAGWLMSNPHFHAQQRKLREEFVSEIASAGFPTRRMIGHGMTVAHSAFHERCLAHYDHWILDGIAGPDLPIPVSPQFPSAWSSVSSAGILSHVIPAYLPVPGQGWFADMFDDTRPTQRQMPHLADWLEIVRKENASLNKVSGYQRRLRLWHYWRGLHRAFPTGLQRSKTRMISVFADFLKVGEDAIQSDLKMIYRLLCDVPID